MVSNNQMLDITSDKVMIPDIWQGRLTSWHQHWFLEVLLDVLRGGVAWVKRKVQEYSIFWDAVWFIVWLEAWQVG